jgi:sigma-70-like protein
LGDLAQVDVADALRAMLPQGSLIARFGGDAERLGHHVTSQVWPSTTGRIRPESLRPDSSIDPLPDVDLWRAVAALSVEQRSVVFLAYCHDLTEAEIADTLDVARSTVHRTLVRARAKLRKALR